MSGGNQDKVAATQLFERVGTIVGHEDQVQNARLGRNNVEVIVGTAAFKGSHELMITSSQGERRATAANIMIAVGTTLATPAKTILGGQPILTSDEIFSLKEMPHSMVLIGCGAVAIHRFSIPPRRLEYARVGSEYGVHRSGIHSLGHIPQITGYFIR